MYLLLILRFPSNFIMFRDPNRLRTVETFNFGEYFALWSFKVERRNIFRPSLQETSGDGGLHNFPTEYKMRAASEPSVRSAASRNTANRKKTIDGLFLLNGSLFLHYSTNYA